MKKTRYTLWALTLVVASWAIAVASAFMAGKGRLLMKAEIGIWDAEGED